MKKRVLSLLICLTLLVGILPTGISTLSAAAADTEIADTAAEIRTVPTGAVHTTESDPWVVTSYSMLKIAFNTSEDQSIMYIKLGADISVSTSSRATLEANGGNVVLDLAGYTISVEDTSNYCFTVIHGNKGTVTITDSTRYDTSQGSGKLVNGKIEYLYKLPDRNTAVLSGNIIMKGGYIINKTHSSGKNINCVYTSGYYGCGSFIERYDELKSIKMYGGVFEADCPLSLGKGDFSTKVTGGELWVKGIYGIHIATDTDTHTTEYPTFQRVHMKNKSGNSGVVAFGIDFVNDSVTSATAWQAWYMMTPANICSYIDGVLQIANNSSMGYGSKTVIGPTFSSTYDLSPVETVSKLELFIDEPAPGDSMSYNATYATTTVSPYDKGYVINNYTGGTWKYGVQWTDGTSFSTEYSVGSKFEGGKKYAVFIKVKPSGTIGYKLADTLTATINGKTAQLYKSGDNEYTVYRTITCPDKTVLKMASINITAPTDGQMLSYSASAVTSNFVIENVNDSIYRNGVRWTVDSTSLTYGAAAEGGKTYRVSVRIKPKDTNMYQFAPENSFNGYINGNKAGVIDITGFSDNSYILYYDFFVPTVIKTFQLTIPEPQPGDAVNFTASAPEGEGYRVSDEYSGSTIFNGVMCIHEGSIVKPADNHHFIAGDDYSFNIWLVPTDAEKYQFAKVADMTATVNGHAATIYRISSTEYYVSYAFTCPTVISHAELTFTEPKAGALPSYDAAVPGGAAYSLYTEEDDDYYSINALMWEYYDGERYIVNSKYKRFEAGVKYLASVSISTSSAYRFASTGSFSATVNGKKANVRRVNDRFYVVEYTVFATKNMIDSVAITIPEPQAGELMPYTPEVPSGAAYQFADFHSAYEKNGIAWQDEDGNYIAMYKNEKFVAGKEYTAVISVVPKDSDLYQFAKDLTCTVNGQPGTAGLLSIEIRTIKYTFTVPSPSSVCLLGDTDGDGEVTIIDATYIQRKLAGIETQSPFVAAAQDTDGDGSLSIVDATFIQRWLAGLSSNENIGKPV